MHNSDDFCECEHDSHFGVYPGEAQPGGTHTYGTVSAETQVKTTYGTFRVCKACAETHLKVYADA